MYDPLHRITEANYSTGDYYHYSYDAVGNRLTSSDQFSVTSYQYDDADRLTSVNGINYTYDIANRLTSVNQVLVQAIQESMPVIVQAISMP